MFSTRGLAILTLFTGSILFYGWIIIFNENDSVRLLGSAIFPIIGGSISSIWLYKAYRLISRKERYFWLLLCMGVWLYVISNVIWLCSQVWGGYSSQFPLVASWIWMLEYFVFLVALIYKIQLISMMGPKNSQVFNILVFMIMASSLSVHFLMKPILTIANSHITISPMTLYYPIMHLSILFVTLTLYYLSSHRGDRSLLIVSGFLLQVFTDSCLIYLRIIGEYELGGVLEPLWFTAIIMIGAAGLYRQKDTSTYQKNEEMENDEFKSEKAFFPYIGVMVFIFIVLNSYGWDFNALSIGACMVFLLIIVRQLMMMKQNKELTDEYRHLAYHDPLTGLKNRMSFKRDLKKMTDRARSENRKIALILIDLDRFKNINDTLGHYIGDCLLQEVSERLNNCIGRDDHLYRLGGDEYIITVPNVSERYCKGIAESILEKLVPPFIVEGYQIAVTPSIGISVFPENGEDNDTLFKSADMAMYLAKRNGKNNFQFYNSELNEVIKRKMKIENELHSAIEKEQLQLFYQPKVDLNTQKTIGVEALLRWEHPELGFIPPNEFIPLAEETGQIVSIGEWVLNMACKQNKSWQESGFDPISVSINVSVRQFQHNDFINTVRDVLKETDLSPQYLELEITESIIQNVKESKDILNSLRSIGVKMSIDDFGTGYSSLYVLRELPIDIIKIDKSFIDDLSDSKNLSMIKTIIDLGLNLDLHVLAEGIEHPSQVNTLLEYNCNSGQGYLFSKPVSAKEFEKGTEGQVPRPFESRNIHVL